LNVSSPSALKFSEITALVPTATGFHANYDTEKRGRASVSAVSPLSEFVQLLVNAMKFPHDAVVLFNQPLAFLYQPPLLLKQPPIVPSLCHTNIYKTQRRGSGASLFSRDGLSPSSW